MLSRFGMKDCELGNTTNSKGDKFSLLQCPRNEIEKKDMKKIPYALVVGSLKCAQVCKCWDVAYIVGMLGRYLGLRLDHWRVVNRVMWYL